MKASKIKIVLFVLTLLFCFKLNAQDKLVGRTYKAQVSKSCNDMVGMDYTYCVLKFEKDSVLVTYRMRIDYPHNEADYNQNNRKKYKWSIKKNIITIKNFSDYGKLIYKGNSLIGRKEMNYKEYKKLIFEQVK